MNRWSSSESETERRTRNTTKSGILKETFPPPPPEFQTGQITSDNDDTMTTYARNGLNETRRKRYGHIGFIVSQNMTKREI